MAIDITKRKIIDLTKKVGVILEKRNLSQIRAQVVLVLDISKSMNQMFKSGAVQSIIERILPLAMKFEDDGAVDVMLFGTRAYQLPAVSIDEIDGYVEREVLSEFRIIEATKYATALKLISNKYQEKQSHPVFVVFITDGNNSDKKESTELIVNLSCRPIFIQFVGIGKEDFPYLNKLDNLSGRFVDNAGFMHVNDIENIDDEKLYNRLLNEFPDWLNVVREKNIL